MYYGEREEGRYVAADRKKLDKLEELALEHRVKPTYRRTCIARNNKRDKTGRYSVKPIYSETLQNGPILALCKQMLPRGSINAVQINRNQPCTTHSDGNIGDPFTIVFGEFKRGSS